MTRLEQLESKRPKFCGVVFNDSEWMQRARFWQDGWRRKLAKAGKPRPWRLWCRFVKATHRKYFGI